MLASVFTVIVTILATAAQASPATSSNLKAVRSIAVDGGKLVFYGVDSTPKARDVDIERRATCGDNIVSCDKKHEAWINTCQQLRSNLSGREGEQVSSKNKKICYELGGNNRCCVSWANEVNFAIRDLFPAFDASMRCNGAAHANLISARATWTKLAGACNTQCLSNGDSNCRN
ncbi:hypothetical protein GQ44DRAFT_763646 [Phaeosphaeriaceae sp. PMI808]|nr:hypothetical protein GQ44DRAFT_763646 [Phaeosphaeriaceae sp. PMI808]